VAELLNENLKVIKVLHQILMAVSAAILAFALRPDLSRDYKAALEEIAALKQVSFGGWSNYVAQHYKAATNQDAKFVRAVVHQAGLRVRGVPDINIPVFCDQVPNSNSRLLDLDTFFAKTQTIGFMKFSTERQPVLDQLTKWKAGRNPNANIIAFNVSSNSGIQYPGGSPMLDWLNRSTSGTSNVMIYLVTDEPALQPGFVSFTYSVSSETGPFALDWLRNDTFGQRLVDPKTGVVFPHLKTFWHQINQHTPDQATVFLQEESEANTRGTLSFFGIQVERRLAISAGPVVSFCILLFMGLHLVHFRSLPMTSDAIRYPWVALFHNWLAKIVTFTSLLILPVSANLALISRYGQMNELSSRISVVMTFLISISGVWVLIEVHRVRLAYFRMAAASDKMEVPT